MLLLFFLSIATNCVHHLRGMLWNLVSLFDKFFVFARWLFIVASNFGEIVYFFGCVMRFNLHILQFITIQFYAHVSTTHFQETRKKRERMARACGRGQQLKTINTK